MTFGPWGLEMCLRVSVCMGTHSSECIGNTIKRNANLNQKNKANPEKGAGGCWIREDWNNNLLLFSTGFTLKSGSVFSSLTFHARKSQMKKNCFFSEFIKQLSLWLQVTRAVRGKNIPRKFLFGFPDDQPWYCVIMAGLLHGVQSFSAGPGTMGTVWSSVCGLRLLLMKETRQQLPSRKLLRYNRLRSQGNINHQLVIHLFRVTKPLVSSMTLHSARIGNELCPKIFAV